MAAGISRPCIFHGEFASALGSGRSERRSDQARPEEQAHLVSGSDRRKNDPSSCPTHDGQPRRRQDGRSSGQPRGVCPATKGSCSNHRRSGSGHGQPISSAYSAPSGRIRRSEGCSLESPRPLLARSRFISPRPDRRSSQCPAQRGSICNFGGITRQHFPRATVG